MIIPDSKLNGVFISFEGIEGSGKSTQIKQIAKYFEGKNVPVVQTMEPGGTPFGKQIRQWILDPKTIFASPYTEFLLFLADRAEHLQKVVLPALQAGKIVLTDRYVDSSMAYQHGARGLPKEMIESMNKWIHIIPDLTILYDIPVKIGLQRAKNRAQLDRFEQENVQFHEKIRKTYLNLAKTKKHFSKINIENKSIDEVYEISLKSIKMICKEKGVDI